MKTDTHNRTQKRAGFFQTVRALSGLVDRKQAGLFALVVAALATSSLVTLAFGYVLKGLVDRGFSAGDTSHLNTTLVIMLGLIALLALASYVRLTISGWLSEKLVTKLRTQAFAHLLTLDPSYYKRRHSGEIASGLSADLSMLGTVVATSLPMIARHGIMVLGGLTMLLVTSTHLTMLVLFVLPLVAIPVVVIGRIVRRNARAAQEQTGALGGLLSETLGAIQTVQSYAAEDLLLKRFTASGGESERAVMRQTHSRSVMVSSIIFILFSSLCAVMWVGAHDVMQGRMSAGALTSFVFYAGLVAGAFGVLGDMGAALFRASAALDRVRDLLAATPVIVSPQAATLPPRFVGNIAFENVVFGYEKGLHGLALDGVSLDVRAGQTVALVGDSGAGKTTIFQLLMRFFDPLEGAVKLDGHDLRTLDLHGLRNAISYVPQDSALFSGSVRDNILLGRPDATPEQVEQAARDAMAHDFIMELPQGYETPLGERGTRLSGGQKQRIALARALLKPAPVLLLDEATAALDSANEKSIQDAVRTLHGKRTVMIIAHRLSTIVDADCIFVVHKGRIVEHGTHQQLVAKGGYYARMVGQQFSHAETHARRAYPDLSGSLQ